MYQSALALALTLPDICGGIMFPNTGTGFRYKAYDSWGSIALSRGACSWLCPSSLTTATTSVPPTIKRLAVVCCMEWTFRVLNRPYFFKISLNRHVKAVYSMGRRYPQLRKIDKSASFDFHPSQVFVFRYIPAGTPTAGTLSPKGSTRTGPWTQILSLSHTMTSICRSLAECKRT